jgi:hypothetical protein
MIRNFEQGIEAAFREKNYVIVKENLAMVKSTPRLRTRPEILKFVKETEERLKKLEQ